MTEQAGIYARESAHVDRYVRIGVAGEHVVSISFPETPAPEAEVGGDHPLLDRIEARLGGDPDDFRDVEVALTMPTDRRVVLETLREVSPGRTVTVETLARTTPGLDVDGPEAVETVRAAVSSNPVPLVVPDHRVRDARGATPDAVAERLRSVES
ncbi:cysteine methyltransferase [Halobacteriales archaeon SW_7_68_16]|nr:MAG: cysteine methyltransferase [Halobacteriales archaeon SW_7_68_16]